MILSPSVLSQLGKLSQTKFQVLGAIQGAHHTPKDGCFFKMLKIQLFCCFIKKLQTIKKLQQWSLYEVIEDILPFVLNTKRPLNDIWLLRQQQNNFGCFQKKSEVLFFQKGKREDARVQEICKQELVLHFKLQSSFWSLTISWQ